MIGPAKGVPEKQFLLAGDVKLLSRLDYHARWPEERDGLCLSARRH